jgi:hypothetical protein
MAPREPRCTPKTKSEKANDDGSVDWCCVGGVVTANRGTAVTRALNCHSPHLSLVYFSRWDHTFQAEMSECLDASHIVKSIRSTFGFRFILMPEEADGCKKTQTSLLLS